MFWTFLPPFNLHKLQFFFKWSLTNRRIVQWFLFRQSRKICRLVDQSSTYGPNGGQIFGKHIQAAFLWKPWKSNSTFFGKWRCFLSHVPGGRFAPIDVPKECTSIGYSKFVHVGLCSVVDLERIIILKVFVNFSVNLTIVWVRPPLQAPAIHMGWKFKLRISW